MQLKVLLPSPKNNCNSSVRSMITQRNLGALKKIHIFYQHNKQYTKKY